MSYILHLYKFLLRRSGTRLDVCLLDSYNLSDRNLFGDDSNRLGIDTLGLLDSSISLELLRCPPFLNFAHDIRLDVVGAPDRIPDLEPSSILDRVGYLASETTNILRQVFSSIYCRREGRRELSVELGVLGSEFREVSVFNSGKVLSNVVGSLGKEVRGSRDKEERREGKAKEDIACRC